MEFFDSQMKLFEHKFQMAQTHDYAFQLSVGEGGHPLDQPLTVAVNIEYSLDESKFVDLHSQEPALIINPQYWKSNTNEPTTSTPKKKQRMRKSKIIPPHIWLPSARSNCTSSNGRMMDLLGR